jgi:hypothetical protein
VKTAPIVVVHYNLSQTIVKNELVDPVDIN